jgi:hypothetical protein
MVQDAEEDVIKQDQETEMDLQCLKRSILFLFEGWLGGMKVD